MYNQGFADTPEIELPPDSPDNRHCWHLYAVRLNLEKLDIGRDAFIRELRQREIGTSVHFIPIPLHPAYASLAKLPQNYCPRAIALYERLISLPLYPAMTEEQVRRVIHAVKEIAVAHRVRLQSGSTIDAVAAQSE
jgi:dTDP-4-amino-4,6-dideoxygalactose transaminase